MAKLNRYNGNVVAFASSATDDNRTVYGDTAQSDDIDDNLNADFEKGWEIVADDDNPTKQDFNALGFTTTQLIAYLFQQGLAEWNGSQVYYINGFAMGSDGKLYQSKTDDNTNNDPTTDNGTNWKDYVNSVAYSLTDVIKDANYTANVGERVWCDTVTNGAWTLTLPANPDDFDEVALIDYKSNFNTDNLTVARNGSKILGLDEDYTANTDDESIIFKAINGDWRII